MRVNTQLLDAKIEESGLKVSFIISKLGLSPEGFYKKKRGEIPFRTAEIYVLCDLLHLSDKEKSLIFYPES
jgi:hypothetical protein